MEVFQGKRRLIELAFTEKAHYECLDSLLNPGGGRLGQRPARCFDHVSEHHQGRFLRLRAGTGVPVFVLGHRMRVFSRFFDGLGIELERLLMVLLSLAE